MSGAFALEYGTRQANGYLRATSYLSMIRRDPKPLTLNPDYDLGFLDLDLNR